MKGYLCSHTDLCGVLSMYTTLSEITYTDTLYSIPSAKLKREVEFNVYLPQPFYGLEALNVLFFNDGQDAPKMKLESILSRLGSQNFIKSLAVVAIKASADRIQEYGVAGQPDFKKRGSKATAYTSFIVSELVPEVKSILKEYALGEFAYAGFSLGGLSAFDIAWHNDDTFSKVGVFSGSFWWRKQALGPDYTDNDRILHQMIRTSAHKPSLKFWLMTGTEDESADRNRNGIIDSIDDTVDVIKELMKKGYHRPADLAYYEKVGGKHDIDTWASAMPKFLTWAFGY